MLERKNISFWILPLITCAAFILCAAIGMLIYPESFFKFFSPTQLRILPPINPNDNYYFDIEYYAQMAINPSCKAFYPLWPFIIRHLFHPQTIEQAAHYFLVISTILFFITNFVLFWVLNTALQSSYLAFWILLAYTVNPMAIFRVIGYTESLFSLFSTLLIWLCLPNIKINKNIQFSCLFILIFLMSLTRPILIQIFFATTVTLITIILLEVLKDKRYFWQGLLVNIKKSHYEMKITVTIWVAALLGYSVYGRFCLKTRNDFFAPFHDQRLWGKSLGIHLEILLFPKSPLFDIIAFYLPLIILFLSLIFTYYKYSQQQNIILLPQYKIWWSIFYLYPPLLIIVYVFNFIKSIKLKTGLSPVKLRGYINNLAVNYIFWFCIYFTTAHSLINFFTFDRLMSLGRHILATPFFFVALGYLYRCLPGKIKYKLLFFMTFISALALLEQWIRYGQDKWLG